MYTGVSDWGSDATVRSAAACAVGVVSMSLAWRCIATSMESISMKVAGAGCSIHGVWAMVAVLVCVVAVLVCVVAVSCLQVMICCAESYANDRNAALPRTPSEKGFPTLPLPGMDVVQEVVSCRTWQARPLP